jgi:hypothetical protein
MNENYNTPGFITLGFVTILITYNWYVFSFIYVHYSYDSVKWQIKKIKKEDLFINYLLFNLFYFIKFQKNPFTSFLMNITFHPIVFLLFWCYYRAIKCDPGFVKKDIVILKNSKIKIYTRKFFFFSNKNKIINLVYLK